MDQKKSEIQIGKESRSLSSDLINPIQPPPIHPKHLQILTQNHSYNTPQKPQNHVQIQVLSHSSSQSLPRCSTSTPSSPTHHQIFKQTQFRKEPIFDKPSASKTHLSSPQKRPIMSQNLSHSPTLSSLHHHRSAAALNSEPSRPSILCFSTFSVVALATKAIAFRVSRYLCCVRWIGVHLRFIILLSLPSLYFFTSNHNNTFFLHFLAVLAVSATLVISLNLALPRFPSIRSLIARSFPIKQLSSAASGSASKSRRPVVWSIGSRTKPEKGPYSGSWVQVYSNGDVYEGEFHKGKCSGSGVYYYSMSGRYEGDWVDGKYDGFGVETWAKGSRYRGHYRQGLRNGFGVYRFYTGDVYAGEWCNGQCHGCGVYTCEDGSQYVGEFRQGVKHGLGHYCFRNGDKYAGEYFADKMHGFGVYHFANGHRYEGAWHEGKRQGAGMYTFRNGDTQSGHWQNGVLYVSSVQGILPGSSFAVNHSKVLNAVQEAQRAAEKAYSMGKVDERVNKAVAAANRSANAARVAAVKAVQNQMHRENSGDDVPIQIV